MTITAVIHDIGRVLIGWDPEGFYDRTIGPDRRRALFAQVDLHGMNLRVDGGAPIGPSVAALADRHPDWANEITLWHSHWSQMVGPPIDRSVRCLRALTARGVKVHALTNFGAETFEIALDLFPFLQLFDQRFVSARLGLLKPDAAIYAAVEQATGLAPAQMLFVDDSPANVAAAAARGWQVHHFTDPAGWADRLVAEGLLTGQEAS